MFGLARSFWRDDRRSIVLGALFLSAAFFILPTRVHERYLFPVFAFLPILAVGNRRWTVALVLFAVGSFINLHAILTIPTYATDNLKNLPFGELFRGYPFVLLSVLLQTAGFAYAAWQLRPAAADEPGCDRGCGPRDQATAHRGARLAPGVGPRDGSVGRGRFGAWCLGPWRDHRHRRPRGAGG